MSKEFVMPVDGISRCEICSIPFIYAHLVDGRWVKTSDPGKKFPDGRWGHSECYKGEVNE